MYGIMGGDLTSMVSYNPTATYDGRDDELIYTGIVGNYYTKSYDDNNHELTYVNSNGNSWTRTYTTTSEYFLQTLNGELEVKVYL